MNVPTYVRVKKMRKKKLRIVNGAHGNPDYHLGWTVSINQLKEMNKFTINTDHYPLKYLDTQKTLSRRQAR